MSRHDKNIICEDEDADIRESRRERERDYGKIKTDLGILYKHTRARKFLKRDCLVGLGPINLRTFVRH